MVKRHGSRRSCTLCISIRRSLNRGSAISLLNRLRLGQQGSSSLSSAVTIGMSTTSLQTAAAAAAVDEIEVSIVWPVYSKMWLELYDTMKSVAGSKEITKLIYKNGIRKRLENTSLLYEGKYLKKKEMHYDVCTVARHIIVVANIMYKESCEEFIAVSSESQLQQPIAKIQRVYVMQENGIRIAVERKFLPYPDAAETITSLNYYDIFNYEYYTCCIHIEIEAPSSTATDKQKLITQLKQCISSDNELVKALVCIMKFGNSTLQHLDMVQPITNASAEQSLCRQFAYTTDNFDDRRPLFVAWKLDGERAKFEIINNVMYIPQWSVEFVLDDVYFAQTLVGHVERIITKSHQPITVYVIIDLYYISSMRLKHMPPTLHHIDAIKILNAFSVKTLYIKGNVHIQLQKFYADEKSMEPCSLPHDGLLKFYPQKIVKCKQIGDIHVVSVDLLMRRNVYNRNLVEFLQKKYTEKCKYVNEANDYACLLTYNNCKPTKHNIDTDILYNVPVYNSLQFNGDRFFTELVDDIWTVDMSNCPNLYTDSNRLINVFVIEFLIDAARRRLVYQRIRYDKYVANSHQVFVDMLKSIE